MPPLHLLVEVDLLVLALRHFLGGKHRLVLGVLDGAQGRRRISEDDVDLFQSASVGRNVSRLLRSWDIMGTNPLVSGYKK